MNYTLLSANRTTHLKIVAVSLACAIVVVLVGIHARTTDIATAQGPAASAVVKAGQPTTFAGQESSAVR
jgi:hypothetical protein